MTGEQCISERRMTRKRTAESRRASTNEQRMVQGRLQGERWERRQRSSAENIEIEEGGRGYWDFQRMVVE